LGEPNFGLIIPGERLHPVDHRLAGGYAGVDVDTGVLQFHSPRLLQFHSPRLTNATVARIGSLAANGKL